MNMDENTIKNQDKTLEEIENRLDQVLEICESVHLEKLSLEKENHELKSKLIRALKEKENFEYQEKLKADVGGNTCDDNGLTASERALMQNLKALKEDIYSFAKRVDSLAYSMEIKEKNNL